MEKPLLLIDVDGVISLFGFDPASPPAGRFEIVDGITHYLSATAGEHLRALSCGFEMIWCTGWEERANEYLPLALGLPDPLPFVTFDAFDRPPGAHWKLAAIDAHVGPDRAVAWIDDAHNDACADWATLREAPTLLVATDPAVGLDETHVEQLQAWASRVSAASLGAQRNCRYAAISLRHSSNDPWRPAPDRKRSSPA